MMPGMVMIRSMIDCHGFLEQRWLCEASNNDHVKNTWQGISTAWASAMTSLVGFKEAVRSANAMR